MKFTHPTLPPEELEALAELFARCADSFMVDGVLDLSGAPVRANHAAIVLDEVAGILGLAGPTELAIAELEDALMEEG